MQIQLPYYLLSYGFHVKLDNSKKKGAGRKPCQLATTMLGLVYPFIIFIFVSVFKVIKEITTKKNLLFKNCVVKKITIKKNLLFKNCVLKKSQLKKSSFQKLCSKKSQLKKNRLFKNCVWFNEVEGGRDTTLVNYCNT